MTADSIPGPLGAPVGTGQTSPATEANAPGWLATALAGSTALPQGAAPIEALLEQGRAHLVGARYRQAYELFHRAGQQAHEADLPATEARAQAFLGYTASTLGHHEEAIEAAMLASQLAQACADDELLQILINNYLGVTLLWNGSHEGAEAVLAQTYERARCLPRGAPGHGSFWQPMINRGFSEVYKRFALRHLRGQQPKARRLQTLLDALDAHAAQAAGRAAAPASLMLSGQLSWLRAWAAAWAGQGALAREHERTLLDCNEALAESPRLQALADWLRAELALADGRREEALLAARKLRTRAELIEHWPLLRIALLLKSDLHEMSGRADAALDCLRQLQQREHQLRQVSMHHRREVAALRFELRQHKREVQSLKSSAQQLQRLSMEDALTGLANRRGLDQRLGEALAGCGPAEGQALYLSVVDVDRFKAVIDRHSHPVGDQVLKALAALFQQLLRSEDIAGRWGGDEFVLAFWAPDEAHAQAVTERLRRAVAQHPWGMLAPGLTVSISLGLTRAHPGDSLDALLLRSDLGMYAHKRQQPAGDAPHCV